MNMKIAKLTLEVTLRIDDAADTSVECDRAEARMKNAIQNAVTGGLVLDAYVETKKIEVQSVSDR